MLRLVQHPLPQNEIPGVHRLIPSAALVAFFLSGLNVERLPQQKALFDIVVINAFLKLSVILQQLSDRQVTGIVGPV